MGKYVEELDRLLRQSAHVDRFPQVAAMLVALKTNRISEGTAAAWLPVVIRFLQEADTSPNVLVPLPDPSILNADGGPDAELGVLLDSEEGTRFGVRFLDRPRHILIAGSTGAGKTTGVRQVILRGADAATGAGRNVSFVVVDRKGGDQADVQAMLGRTCLHISMHDGTRMGLNAPPAVPPRVWINVVSQLFAARAGLIASRTTFARMLDWLYGVLNLERSDRVAWPNFRLILDVVERAPYDLFSAKGEYTQSLRQAMEAVVQATQLFESFGGLDLERDVISQGRSIVIDCPNLEPPFLRLFVADLLIAQMLVGRIHRGHKVDTTEVVVVLDEADADVSRAADEAFSGGWSPVAALVKQGRELGLQLVVAVSMLGPASRFIQSNVQTQIIFNLPDAESLFEAQKTLLLPQGGAQMIAALQPGECLIRHTQAPWSHAMRGKVDYLPPCRTPKTSGFDQLPWIPAKRLHELPAVEKALQALIDEHRSKASRKQRSKKAGLSATAQRFLEAVAKHPFMPVARLWALMGGAPPARKLSVHRELADAKLADFEEVRIGRANVLLVELTDTGIEALGTAPVRHRGRGSTAHRHFAHWIAEVGRRRTHDIGVEWRVPGTTHDADVAWCINSTWHVFEVAVECDTNLIAHISKSLGASTGVATLTVVSAQAVELARIRERLFTDSAIAPFISRLKFERVEDFYQELWP